MSLDSDVIVDRRRMRRKLTFWRVAAALVAIAAIVTVGVVASPVGRSAFTTSGSIARVHIDGLIRSDNDRVEALERLEKSRAAAVIVHINSPGGTTAGSEQLYDALVRLKAKKPLVVVVEGLAASGGYIAEFAGRLHRRAVPVSEFWRAPENRRRQGRGSQIVAVEGRAQRF
jgi:protease-4